MRKWLTFLVLMRAVTASAQLLPPTPQTITTQDSGAQCSVAGTCAEWAVTGAPSYTVQAVAAPTFSGTLTLRTTSDGRTWVTTSFTLLATGALVTTLSAAGSAAISNTGIQRIRVVGTTVSSGAMTMTLTGGTASARGGGGGGGGGGVTGGTCTNQSVTAIDTSGIPTCTTITSDFIDSSIPTIASTNTFTGRQNSTGAASTAPAKSGTSLPATCTVGDVFFKTDATAGANLYSCTTTNNWSAPGTGFFTAAGPTQARTYTFPDANAVVLTDATKVTVAQGGTNLASGTSGGVLAYTAAGTLASSAALAANQLVLGGGAGAAPATLGSTGSTTTVLHGSAGAPTYAAVSLTADVSGQLPVANGGSGSQFFTVSGLASTAKTFTFPNANATVLTSNAAVTVPQGGTGAATFTADGILYGNGTSALGVTAAGTSGQVLTSNGAGVAPTYQTVSGTGTVTSVTTTVPSFLTATGCVITTAGTCAITTTSQSPNLFLASPDGTSGAPTVRAMVSGDFPSALTETSLTTGSTIAVYGVSYGVKCASACTQVLPTVSGQTGSTIAFCIDDDSALVTLDAAGSETINGQLTRIMLPGECAAMRVRAGEWRKMDGRSIAATVTASRVMGNTSALAMATDTTIAMDTNESGQSSMWDSGNTRIKAIRPGLYKVTLSVRAATSPDNFNDYLLYFWAINGSTVSGGSGAFGTQAVAFISPDLTLAAGDYILMRVNDTEGGAVISGTGTSAARMTLTEVAPW